MLDRCSVRSSDCDGDVVTSFQTSLGLDAFSMSSGSVSADSFSSLLNICTANEEQLLHSVGKQDALRERQICSSRRK